MAMHRRLGGGDRGHEPEAKSTRWAGVLGEHDRLDGATLVPDEGAIRFVPVPSDLSRGVGVSGIDLTTPGPPKRFEFGGCHVGFVADS